MEVTFRKTGSRQYAIDVRRERFPDVTMDPAPGFDLHLPHDLVHFVVEAEMGLDLGVYGQLAKGGDAGTFRKLSTPQLGIRNARRERRRESRRAEPLSKAGHLESVFSERAAVICEYAWLMRSGDPDLLGRGRGMTPFVKRMREECSPTEAALLTPGIIESVCGRFDELSRKWAALEVGSGITLRWPH